MIFHLLIGTTKSNEENIRNGIYNKIVYASDNLETLAHYYEGSAIIIEIDLNPNDMKSYKSNEEELENDYTWGCMNPIYPENSTWFSISGDYMKNHILKIYSFPDELLNNILKYYSDQE